MDGPEMVVLIVLIVMATGVARAWLRRPAPGNPHLDARIAQLEDRVRALEAVVTDHGYEVKKQIRELERS